MKTLEIFAISFSLSILSFGSGFAQSAKLQSGDSDRVELERAVLSKELTQLHDSISRSLRIFDSCIENASPAKRKKLENSHKELIEYGSRIKLDIDEISSTAQNAWRDESVKRMRANTSATRREYKRIQDKHKSLNL